MSDTLVTRAADAMAKSDRIAMPLGELAALLGPAATADVLWLESRLRDDPRFRVLEPPLPMPDLPGWLAATGSAYKHAFARAGLLENRLVVFTGEADMEPAPSLDALLRATVRRLVAREEAGIVTVLAAESACERLAR